MKIAAPAKATPWPPRSAWQAGWLRRCGREICRPAGDHPKDGKLKIIIMKIFLKALICSILLASFLLAIPAAQAAGLVPCNGAVAGNGLPKCEACHILGLIVNITEFLFKQIALPLAGLMFLVGGIMMMLAAGSETRYKKGKEILVNALFGLVIVLAAFAIVNTLIMFFASGSFSSGWWQVNC